MNSKRIFAIACALLGVMAVSQLLIAGIALATRFEKGQKVQIVEKEVERIVTVQVPAPEPRLTIQARPTPELPPIPDPEKIAAPAIADPRAQSLVAEAQTARVAGDMGMAIVKLEEALIQSPNDPNVLFEMGLVHEVMEVYDKASAYYEQVFQMGVTGAGGLYNAAATKLRDGFAQLSDLQGKLALGRVRIFNDPNAAKGQRVVLSIPVLKASGQEVASADIEVVVKLFNKSSKGEIIELTNESWTKTDWSSLPFDWAGGEETLRVDYNIPAQDNQTTHLFGKLTYYGQVATLTYKGELIDVQAWPRDLAAKAGQPPTDGSNHFPEFLDQDFLPPNFDPDIPLLTPLPSE